MRDRTFERNVHRLKHNSLTRKQSIEGTRTVRCAAISRIARTARSHRAQNYCEQNSLLMLSAAGRHCHHRLQDGERSKCLRSLLSSVASAASFPTYASSASPLRLSGEPPDSRRGGGVTFNPLRRAGCEGARQSRGSHAATWNGRLGWVHVRKAAKSLLGFGVCDVPQGGVINLVIVLLLGRRKACRTDAWLPD